MPIYIGGQVAAALFAAALLKGLVGTEASLGATSCTVGLGAGFALEVVLTFFLMFVITAVATDARASGSHAALPIGATVTLCALMGGPLTGASMNPARSIGPALLAGQPGELWLYTAAPLLGAALGAFAYQAIRGDAPAG